MKQYVRSLVVALFSVLLLFSHVLPMVYAQRFSNTNAATTEQGTHFFQEVMTEDRTKNAMFLTAFEDYQAAVDQLVLHDINDDESGGTTVDEVADLFTASVEGQYVELTEDESYFSYMYYEGEKSQAELLLYFVGEQLYYIGLSNLQVDIDISEFVSNELMQTWVDGEVTVSDMAAESFRITGISEVLYGGTVYHMIMIPTGDSEDDLNIDYTIFAGDNVYESYMLDFYYSFNAPQDNMIQYFAYFLGVSEEYPIAE